MNERRWFAGSLVSALIAGCTGVPAPTAQVGDRQTASQAASAPRQTVPIPMGTPYVREKLAQAETAMRNNDYLQVQLLLEQAEAAAWLEEARERNRLLLEIDARRAELSGKRAREALALSESAQQAARAAADRAKQTEARGDHLETKPPAPETKLTPLDKVITLGDVAFDGGSAVLRPEAGPTIDRLAEFLRAHPQRGVLIEGFTDSAGSGKYNLALSERRANAVRQALVKRGVAVERIRVRGYGSAHPVASNSNKGGRQQNRRVEIVVSDAEGRIPDRRAIASK